MISVIVPVYNVEKYLRRCVDSIINQTYKDFEIILVDDGSKDTSPAICDEYAKKYSNIKVIHQKNAGPSVTRNEGTSIAKGDYITYIDSDDLVHPDYLKILIDLCSKNNADLSCCNFAIFSKESEIISNENTKSNELCFSGIEAMNKMLYGQFHGSSACAILLNSKLAKSIAFTSGRYHEDDLISFKYYLNSNKVAITDKKLYYYFQRPGSIMHSKYGKIAIDELNAADYIVENCKKIGKESTRAAYSKMFANYKDVLFSYPDLKKIDLLNYKRIKKNLRKISFSIIFNTNISKRTRLSAFILKILGINMFCFFHKKLGL